MNNDRPTVKENIERDLKERIADMFSASISFDTFGSKVRTSRKEKASYSGIVFNTSVNIFGKDFTDFEEAKKFAFDFAFQTLVEFSEDKPTFFLANTDREVPIVDGWAGHEHPTKEGWERVYGAIGEKYGKEKEMVVRTFIATKGNRLAQGIPFWHVFKFCYIK